MKITVITGSPRKHGNSFAMTDAFIREAETLGHTVRRFDAAQMKIGGCRACQTCFKTGKACSFDDDFNKIADDLLEAEGWVFSFPIYWYSIPGQTKCIIDNIFSFFVGGKDFKGKKVALISCCQESDMTVFDGAVKPIERGAKLCKWDMVGNVLVPGVDAVGDIAKTDGCAQAAALADKF